MITLYEVTAHPTDHYDRGSEIKFRGRFEKAKEFVTRLRMEHPDYKIIIHELPPDRPSWARWHRKRKRRKTEFAV